MHLINPISIFLVKLNVNKLFAIFLGLLDAHHLGLETVIEQNFLLLWISWVFFGIELEAFITILVPNFQIHQNGFVAILSSPEREEHGNISIHRGTGEASEIDAILIIDHLPVLIDIFFFQA